MNAAASAGDFFVTSAGDALFVFRGACGGVDQMRVRIDEPGKNNTSAEVEFTRAARFAEAFNAATRSDGGDTSVANQQRAIANDAEIAKREATARRRPSQSEKLRAASDEHISQLRGGREFSHGCQRY